MKLLEEINKLISLFDKARDIALEVSYQGSKLRECSVSNFSESISLISEFCVNGSRVLQNIEQQLQVIKSIVGEVAGSVSSSNSHATKFAPNNDTGEDKPIEEKISNFVKEGKDFFDKSFNKITETASKSVAFTIGITGLYGTFAGGIATMLFDLNAQLPSSYTVSELEDIKDIRDLAYEKHGINSDVLDMVDQEMLPEFPKRKKDNK